MKKILTLLIISIAFGSFASVSEATCTVTGEISRISINSITGNSIITVTRRPNAINPFSIYQFSSTDRNVVNAALSAHSNDHEQIRAVGNSGSGIRAPECMDNSQLVDFNGDGKLYGGEIISFTLGK